MEDDFEKLLKDIESFRALYDKIYPLEKRLEQYHFLVWKEKDLLYDDYHVDEFDREERKKIYDKFSIFYYKHVSDSKTVTKSKAQILAKFFLHLGLLRCKHYGKKYVSHKELIQPYLTKKNWKQYTNDYRLVNQNIPKRKDYYFSSNDFEYLQLGLIYQAYVFDFIHVLPNPNDNDQIKESFIQLHETFMGEEWSEKLKTLDLATFILLSKSIRALCMYKVSNLYSRVDFNHPFTEVSEKMFYDLYKVLVHFSQDTKLDLSKVNNQLRRITFKDDAIWSWRLYLRDSQRKYPLSSLQALFHQIHPGINLKTIQTSEMKNLKHRRINNKTVGLLVAIHEQYKKIEPRFQSILKQFEDMMIRINSHFDVKGVDSTELSLYRKTILLHNYYTGNISETELITKESDKYELLNEINLFEFATRRFLINGYNSPYVASSYPVRRRILQLHPELNTYEVMHRLFGISPKLEKRLNTEDAPAEHIALRNRAIVNQFICARALSKVLYQLYRKKVILATRGTTGSEKTRSVREIVGDHANGALSQDPPKFRVRNGVIRNHQVKDEISTFFKEEFYPEVSLHHNLSFVLDSRLLELKDVKELIHIAKTIGASIHIFDRDIEWETSANRDLVRSDKDEDPVVDLMGLLSGFIRARSHRYSIVKLIEREDLVEEYRLFYRGQLVALKCLREGIRYAIYNEDLYKRCFVVPTPAKEYVMLNRKIDRRYVEEAIARQDLASQVAYNRLRYWADKGVSISEALTRHANGEE
jgi:hypothetical protein